MENMESIAQELADLVTANHILANEEVVDAFGHVSIRHPNNPERYILSCSRAPALVTGNDLMEFTLDGDPIDPRDRRPYAERPIHGALYEIRPDVMAVVHNHSYDVIPFSVTGAAIKPIFHTAAGIGPEVPIWDIRDRFGDTNMLVTTMDQGRDLARAVGAGRAALMRGHGCVVAGKSLREAVLVSIYLQVNARLQMQALQLGNVTYLSPEEERLYGEMHFSPLIMDRTWEYFVTRAGGGGGKG